MNPIMRIAVIAAVFVVAVGIAFLAWRPTSNVAVPPSPSLAVPTIEGSWEVEFTREEMLAAGISDPAEDNNSNYGQFRLTLEGGRWALRQLAPVDRGGGVSTYTVDPAVAHLYAPRDGVTFDIPYVVTPTTLTFGPGGPVTFRVKSWTRATTELLPQSPTATGPLKFGIYDGPTLQVADLIAAVNADPTLTPEERTQVIDVFLGIRGHVTWRDSIELLEGQLFERQTIDGVTGLGSFGAYAFPTDQTLLYTEGGPGTRGTRFDLTISGETFTLHRTTPANDAADEFVTRTIFESGPFVLR
ncbi:MAG TPA: hypothetical protein VFI15_09855 [Candidatus Limnocylindrales bacterium]|nr:hypothetical protein [Candidatus Limnocylindrales bacterium]